jgi:hypothetical protein
MLLSFKRFIILKQELHTVSAVLRQGHCEQDSSMNSDEVCVEEDVSFHNISFQ